MVETKLKWDEQGSRYYETGVSKGVLYTFNNQTKKYNNGVVWNGLTSVSENPTGGEANAIYADNIKYLNLMSIEELEATIEAYTYPDEFAECDGSAEITNGITIGQQPRKMFALCYQTKVGSDTDSEKGYKIHILYGCMASPSDRSYETVNDSPSAITFSWSVKTTPVEVEAEGFKPTALLVIDSTKVTSANMDKIVAKLYGTKGASTEQDTEATLLTPDEILDLLK